MTSSAIAVTGMVPGNHVVGVDQLIEHSVVDSRGRVLVSMIDLLALMRPSTDADLLLFEFGDGASQAVRISEVVQSERIGVQVRCTPRPESAALWSAHLRPSASPSPPIVSVAAISFAEFVGSS